MTWAEKRAEVHRLARESIIDDAFIRAFEEGYDGAERRKQALKERIRQMDAERTARYSVTW